MWPIRRLILIAAITLGSTELCAANAVARPRMEGSAAWADASASAGHQDDDSQPAQSDAPDRRIHLPVLAMTHRLQEPQATWSPQWPTAQASTPQPPAPRSPTPQRPTSSPPTALPGDVAPAVGPRLFKSGPIQISADGRWLWVANAHASRLSRIDTESGHSQDFAIGHAGVGAGMNGLSVLENGAEVWATAHDTDRVHVLDGATGEPLATIQLPWGCGPYGIALSPPIDGRQAWALVSCMRAEALIAIDTASREQIRLAPVFRSPFGIAWTDARTAWVTHLYPDSLQPHITGLSFDGAAPRIRSHLWFAAATPRDPRALEDPIAERNVAEGGYVNLRGHPARFPGEKHQLWLPTQYHNVEPNLQRESYGPQPDRARGDGAQAAHVELFAPDSSFQASIRRFDLDTHQLSVHDKVILTARHVHDPTKGERNPPWIGYGWDASISGLVDIGFSRIDGRLYSLLLAEQSDELVLMPADARPYRSTTDAAAPGLPELRLGSRPMGLVVHPDKALAFSYNSLSFDVSEVDLSDPARPRERRRIPVADAEPWSPLASPSMRNGAKIFYGSADPRISLDERVSCASCHINGEHDGHTWAFQVLPRGTAGQAHGMRNTPTLRGLGARFASGQRDAVLGWGQLHQSGDRDEIQDFEYTFVSPLMGGTGFLGPSSQAELGPPNAGLSPDLDDLADYLMQLDPLPRSPYRASDGGLSEAAVRGAASFLGSDPEHRPADADCASCHVPEAAFLDHRFHDVGRRRDRLEEELGDTARRAACIWCVKTPSLIGVWDTAPYEGLAYWLNTLRDMISLRDVVEDMGQSGRAIAHGAVAQLSGPQRADLAAFVASIDGDMQADQLRTLRDRSAPRIARVSVTSLKRLEVWFSESIDRSGATEPGSWDVLREHDGQSIAVSRVVWDDQNADRVSLYLPLEVGEAYRLQVTGAIRDLADQASGGLANLLDADADVNRPRFEVGDRITITLGSSGYENLSIPVHDAGPVGPDQPTWSNDRVQLIIGMGANVPGFVRFDWQEAMQEVTGLMDPSKLEAASFSLTAWAGDAQDVELRRVLQSWSDPVAGGDQNQDPVGGPSWRDHSHPDKPWNLPGAGKLGGSGRQVQDYDGDWDLAATVDLLIPISAVNGPVHFGGDGITQAFRFWLEHPEQDYGYALRLPGSQVRPFVSFRRAEDDGRDARPVLHLTYRP